MIPTRMGMVERLTVVTTTATITIELAFEIDERFRDDLSAYRSAHPCADTDLIQPAAQRVQDWSVSVTSIDGTALPRRHTSIGGSGHENIVRWVFVRDQCAAFALVDVSLSDGHRTFYSEFVD
jgi:hypothetical protein